MAMSSPSKDDKKKNENAIIESGKGLPEGNPEERPLKYFQVVCPKCRAANGYPCTFGTVASRNGSHHIIDPYSIHISRVLLYEAYVHNKVNELGINANGIPATGGLKE